MTPISVQLRLVQPIGLSLVYYTCSLLILIVLHTYLAYIRLSIVHYYIQSIYRLFSLYLSFYIVNMVLESFFDFLVPMDISGVLPLPSPSSKSHCQKRVIAVMPIVPATLGYHCSTHPTTKAKAQSDRTNNPEQNLTKNSHKVFDMRPHMLPKASNYQTRASCTTSSAHVLHVSDIEPSRASMLYTRLRPSTFVHVGICIINLRQYLALAVEFLLTFDH